MKQTSLPFVFAALAVYASAPALRAQTTSVNFTLHSCDNSNGNGDVNPTAPLLVGADGKFYGTTYGTPGTGYAGSIFQISPQGQYANLHTCGDDGARPNGGLIEGDDGNFYGLTTGGGTNGYGVFFRQISPAVQGYTVLHQFTSGAGGKSPQGTLVRGDDGNFYGVTLQGGTSNHGIIFKINTAGHLDAIHNFAGGAEGGNPTAGLVQADDGTLYGTTSSMFGESAGTVYKITPAGLFTTLYAFTGGADGNDPRASLILGGDGKLYGTTRLGGPANRGTIFSITLAGALTTLHSFAAGEGNHPLCALLRDDDGVFYGTTQLGGSYEQGTVFLMSPAGVVQTIYSFNGSTEPDVNSNGAQPQGALVHNQNQNDRYFYGTTYYGGVRGEGTVFRLTVSLSPVITSAASATATVGRAFSYRITATHNPFSFGAQDLPPYLSLNETTGVISGTPNAAGTVHLTLNAYDGSGKGSSPLTLTIKPAVPVITSAATATAKQGSTFTYQITATENPTSFGVQGLPTGFSVNAKTGLITGTPKGAGKVTLTLNASNAAGKGSATLTLTIKAAPPVVTSAATASGKVNTAFSYQITATNQPTSFGVQGLPSGLAVDSKTGLISGTSKAAGKFTLTLNAYNTAGKGSATLTLTIVP